VGYLEASADDTKKKLEAVASDVTGLKTTLGILQPLIISVSKGIWTLVWAVISGLAVFVLAILGMWIKHHFGW